MKKKGYDYNSEEIVNKLDASKIKFQIPSKDKCKFCHLDKEDDKCPNNCG